MISTYDPTQVSILYGGQVIQGFSEDRMVRLEYQSDRFAPIAGCRGEFSRTKLVNKQGTLTIYLLSTSSSNDYLSNISNADYYGGGQTQPLLVRDALGTSVATATTSYIIKIPPLEFTNKIETREWVIHIADLTMFAGGNNLK